MEAWHTGARFECEKPDSDLVRSSLASERTCTVRRWTREEVSVFSMVGRVTTVISVFVDWAVLMRSAKIVSRDLATFAFWPDFALGGKLATIRLSR